MNDESLRQLLGRAGPEQPARSAPRDFAARVQRLAERRTRRRQIATSVGVGVVALFGAWTSSLRFDARVDRELAIDAQSERDALAALDRQATEAEAVASAILKKRRLTSEQESVDRALGDIDPALQIAQHLEVAAGLGLARAERAHAAGDEAMAGDDYRRVVELFPHSASARTASERLAQLTNNP